jgi:hypothetical protein
MKVYTQATKRRQRLSRPHLKAYDQAIEWALMGTSAVFEAPSSVAPTAP